MSLRSGLVGWVLVLAGCGALAQDAPQPDGPIHTLRVFANLMQIPTVVLDTVGDPVLEKSKPKFMVTIDGGKPFAASHVRLEGDDPISLAVLLDASGSQADLLREMARTLALLAPDPLHPRADTLHPHDHVSIYAIDCTVVRSVEDAPADAATLRGGVEAVLKAPILHRANGHGDCAGRQPLRSALLSLANRLHDVPGRRVILVVSDGEDGSKDADWMKALIAMQQTGTAVFGMAQSGGSAVSLSGRGGPAVLSRNSLVYTASFDSLCESSGGLMLLAQGTNLKQKLTDFIHLVRARYIVQFPRPSGSAGSHLIEIKVPGRPYFIRASGTSVPIEDPSEKIDPALLQAPPPEEAKPEL